MSKWIARVTGLFALFAGCAVHAQPYPSKPVRLLVGFAPGGSVDIVARLLAGKLTESMGQQFVVDNRAGAAGNIAAQAVAKAPGDGYTLLLASTTALASGPSIFKQLPYDPQRDFVPVALLVHQPYVLVLHPSLPTRTLKEFIALAKARPGELMYASSGAGGGQHMAAVNFAMVTGVSIMDVPYKGGAPAMTDLMAGRVQLMFQTVPTVIEQIRGGKLRALAVTSPKRNESLPNVPTMREAGAPFDYQNWMGLAAPASTPKDIVSKLNGEARKAMSDGLVTRFSELGLQTAGGTPEQFAAYVKEEIEKYAKLVKASGMEKL